MRCMRSYMPFTMSLLLAGMAVLAVACATDSGGGAGRESAPGPMGRAGAGRRMAQRDRQQLQEPWKQYDLNGDGKISLGEFMAVRAACFARYDAMGVGVITRAEAQKVFPPQQAERMGEEFSRLDLDGDGLISRAEFDQESDRLFRQLDTNGDGVIAGSELGNVIPAVLGYMCSEGSDRRPGPSGETNRTGRRRDAFP